MKFSGSYELNSSKKEVWGNNSTNQTSCQTNQKVCQKSQTVWKKHQQNIQQIKQCQQWHTVCQTMSNSLEK